MQSGDYMSAVDTKDDTDDILHVLERVGVYAGKSKSKSNSISKSKLNSTCGKIADRTLFKGMEQILVRKLLSTGFFCLG